MPSAPRIAGSHRCRACRAPSAAQTDWTQIVRLYDVLLQLSPSAVVELNRAVAVAMRDGAEAGLLLVDALLARGHLQDYHLSATRADLLRQLARLDELARRTAAPCGWCSWSRSAVFCRGSWMGWTVDSTGLTLADACAQRPARLPFGVDDPATWRRAATVCRGGEGGAVISCRNFRPANSHCGSPWRCIFSLRVRRGSCSRVITSAMLPLHCCNALCRHAPRRLPSARPATVRRC